MTTKPSFRALLLAALLCGVGTPLAKAQILTQTFAYGPNAAIPDNSTAGVSDTELVTSSIATITSIQVSLQITGNGTAYNGDFYAYLTNGTGFSVLLNRAGRTAGNPYGYADNGFNVSFAAAAANGDIHNYQTVLNPAGVALTGVWQPDGRNVNPANSLDTSARSAMLDSFSGQNPNANWTLFVADVSPVGTGTFTGWSMQITGVAVPEPSPWLLVTLFATLAWLKSISSRRPRHDPAGQDTGGARGA